MQCHAVQPECTTTLLRSQRFNRQSSELLGSSTMLLIVLVNSTNSTDWWEQKKPSTYGHTCDADTGPDWMEPSDVTPPGRTDPSGEGDCDMWGK